MLHKNRKRKAIYKDIYLYGILKHCLFIKFKRFSPNQTL